MAKTENDNLVIGVVFPIRDDLTDRPANATLKECADWSREKVNATELESHQLPNCVPKPNGRGQYRKPDYW